MKRLVTASIFSVCFLSACRTPLLERFTPEEQPPAGVQQSAMAFRVAVNNAMAAAEQVQTANAADEWHRVAELWQSAIDLMQAVADSSPHYEVAQQKIIEYGEYAEYALSQAEQAGFIEFVALVRAEATSKARRYRETHTSLFGDCTNNCGLQNIEVTDDAIRIFFRPVPNHIATIGPDNPKLTKEILDFASPFRVLIGAPPDPENAPQNLLACALELPHKDKVSIYGIDNQNNVIAVWQPCLGNQYDNTLVGLEFN